MSQSHGGQPTSSTPTHHTTDLNRSPTPLACLVAAAGNIFDIRANCPAVISR
jgi:hypothetical protein